LILGRKLGSGAIAAGGEVDPALSHCAYCPKLCTFACPVSRATHRETHSPWGKQTTLFEIARGMVPMGREYVEPLFACTNCHACTSVCDHGIDVPVSLLAGRARVLEAGLLPDPLRILLRDQPAREDEARRAVAALAGSIGPSSAARTVLFPGCGAALEDPDMVRAALSITRTIEGDSTAAFQDLCCGLPYLLAGDVSGFVEAARKLAEESRAWSRIVVLDPGCAWTMRRLYPEHGVELQAEVTTLVEYVLPHLHRFVRRSNPQGPVFYHDPCHLGRGLGLYDPPREILLRLVAGGARDLSLTRESEPCCGGGGAIPESMPDVARAVADRLVECLRGEGARTVVTACPTCRTHLLGHEDLAVVDLVTLLAQAL
jgi:Fe-S oxidoreductase